MKISHSTFYYRGGERSFEELKAEANLKDKIEKICLDWPRYGYRRVTKQLHREELVSEPQEGPENDAGERPSLPDEKTRSENHQQ